jgi:hypothetical protein
MCEGEGEICYGGFFFWVVVVMVLIWFGLIWYDTILYTIFYILYGIIALFPVLYYTARSLKHEKDKKIF